MQYSGCRVYLVLAAVLTFGTLAAAAPSGRLADTGTAPGAGQREAGTADPAKPQPPPFGDIDGDGDIDQDDINILVKDLNKSVGESRCGNACDIHIDGMISTEDLHKLKEYCTRPNCATK